MFKKSRARKCHTNTVPARGSDEAIFRGRNVPLMCKLGGLPSTRVIMTYVTYIQTPKLYVFTTVVPGPLLKYPKMTKILPPVSTGQLRPHATHAAADLGGGHTRPVRPDRACSTCWWR